MAELLINIGTVLEIETEYDSWAFSPQSPDFQLTILEKGFQLPLTSEQALAAEAGSYLTHTAEQLIADPTLPRYYREVEELTTIATEGDKKVLANFQVPGNTFAVVNLDPRFWVANQLQDGEDTETCVKVYDSLADSDNWLLYLEKQGSNTLLTYGSRIQTLQRHSTPDSDELIIVLGLRSTTAISPLAFKGTEEVYEELLKRLPRTLAADSYFTERHDEMTPFAEEEE